MKLTGFVETASRSGQDVIVTGWCDGPFFDVQLNNVSAHHVDRRTRPDVAEHLERQDDPFGRFGFSAIFKAAPSDAAEDWKLTIVMSDRVLTLPVTRPN